jgi:hypothetical protein
MASVPTANAAVEQVAICADERLTAVQPLMAAPFEVNTTVPVGVGGPAGETVAVNVTESPTVEGFRLEIRAVVVAVLEALFTTCVKAPLLPPFVLSPE